MLCFEAQTAVLLVVNASVASQCAIEIIGCIQLNPWFGGHYFHNPSTDRFKDCGTSHELSAATIKNKVVVITNRFVGELTDSIAYPPAW